MTKGRSNKYSVAACALVLAWGFAALLHSRPAAARALTASEEAGSWDLTFEKGNRRCRVTLHDEAGTTGRLLAMPAGCRHAFPSLAAAASWTAQSDDHIVFRSADGEALMDFAPAGGPVLSAIVGEGGDIYMLAPVDRRVQAALAEPAPAPAEALPGSARTANAEAPGGGVLVDRSSDAPLATASAVAVYPPATIGEIAGHYAVVRQDRDTGCMVTLDDGDGGRTELKARLAPACRDQGIVIFDPVGWQLSKGQLILTAKKGHKAALSRRGQKTWATTPAKGVALVLKRL